MDIKLTPDILHDPKIKVILGKPSGAKIVVFWLDLIVRANEKNKTGVYVFSVVNEMLTNEVIGAIFDFDAEFIGYAFGVLEEFGMVIREEKRLLIDPFWRDAHDRSSPEYKMWRYSVLERDGFRCRWCGAKKNLSAHHIVYWRDTKDDRDLRYDINNGITLCGKCHLKAHGGNWRNG